MTKFQKLSGVLSIIILLAASFIAYLIKPIYTLNNYIPALSLYQFVPETYWFYIPSLILSSLLNIYFLISLTKTLKIKKYDRLFISVIILCILVTSFLTIEETLAPLRSSIHIFFATILLIGYPIVIYLTGNYKKSKRIKNTLRIISFLTLITTILIWFITFNPFYLEIIVLIPILIWSIIVLF